MSELDSRCWALPSKVSEFQSKVASQCSEASNPPLHSRLTGRQFQKGRYWGEEALAWTYIWAVYLFFWYLPHWIVAREVHCQIVAPCLPRRIFRSRYFAFPSPHIQTSIFIRVRLGHKSIRMVISPLLSLFLESVDDEFANFFVSLHEAISIVNS